MNVRSSIGRFAAATGVAMTLLPGAAFAAEIKLMCPAPMRTTIVELVAQFERAHPHKVDIVHTPSSFIVKRVLGGEAVEALLQFLTSPAAAAVLKAKGLAPPQ
jgi:ABC-type glycerol-3-phosphate transport system substrate-binding protein